MAIFGEDANGLNPYFVISTDEKKRDDASIVVQILIAVEENSKI
ncbi:MULTISPECIES: hypothetical protein [Pantoea]|nr:MULTISPECIES: hypothetical protein [Pantoea]